MDVPLGEYVTDVMVSLCPFIGPKTISFFMVHQTEMTASVEPKTIRVPSDEYPIEEIERLDSVKGPMIVVVSPV
jgi:hypothetical protein